MRVILLGPQRRPTVDAVVRSLGLDGPVATITAGWQEREADDGELSRRLGGRDTNLGLYRRWLDVQDRDPEYAAGERALQGVLAELQDIYLLRLDYALQAVYALRAGRRAGQRAGPAEAVAAVRELDEAHLRRVNRCAANSSSGCRRTTGRSSPSTARRWRGRRRGRRGARGRRARGGAGRRAAPVQRGGGAERGGPGSPRAARGGAR